MLLIFMFGKIFLIPVFQIGISDNGGTSFASAHIEDTLLAHEAILGE
jgi:hypothetical protein